MNIVALTVALVVVVIGVVSQRIHLQNPPPSPEDNSVLSTDDSASSSATPGPTIEEPTQTPVPNAPSSPSPQPTAANNDTDDINSLRYPGSSVIQSSDSSLTLSSRDNPDTVTAWYKAYLENRHMNVKSFVTTKANDKVHNVLVGAGDGEIRVTITRDSANDETHIVVERT